MCRWGFLSVMTWFFQCLHHLIAGGKVPNLFLVWVPCWCFLKNKQILSGCCIGAKSQWRLANASNNPILCRASTATDSRSLLRVEQYNTNFPQCVGSQRQEARPISREGGLAKLYCSKSILTCLIILEINIFLSSICDMSFVIGFLVHLIQKLLPFASSFEHLSLAWAIGTHFYDFIPQASYSFPKIRVIVVSIGQGSGCNASARGRGAVGSGRLPRCQLWCDGLGLKTELFSWDRCSSRWMRTKEIWPWGNISVFHVCKSCC